MKANYYKPLIVSCCKERHFYEISHYVRLFICYIISFFVNKGHKLTFELLWVCQKPEKIIKM